MFDTFIVIVSLLLLVPILYKIFYYIGSKDPYYKEHKSD